MSPHPSFPDHPSCGIKFCGLRTEDDVRTALRLKAAAVGFVLTESPRQIDAATCQHLRALVPAEVRVHGVFAADDPDYIRDCVRRFSLDVAQVHGPEDDPRFWSRLAGLPLIRAFRIRPGGSLKALDGWRAKEVLLDAYVPGLAGGTGQTFDWTAARKAGERYRVILAGGLTPANVAEAISVAQPWMVDVSGGIESSKGVKDHALMEAFARAVNEAGKKR